MHQTGMVKICMVLATSMRHQYRSVAPNVTNSVILLPHIRSVRSQRNQKHGTGVIVVQRLERYIHRLKWVLLIYSMHLFIVFVPFSMFHLLFPFCNVVLSFSQLQHGAPALPPHYMVSISFQLCLHAASLEKYMVMMIMNVLQANQLAHLSNEAGVYLGRAGGSRIHTLKNLPR